MNSIVCLRFDVDTRSDVDSLPKVLSLLKEHSFPATIFVATGRDLGISQLLRHGISSHSIENVFRYGSSIIPMLVSPLADIEARTARAVGSHGSDFEFSLHGIDHFRWCNGVGNLTRSQTSKLIDEAMVRFRNAFGFKPLGFAPPCFASNRFIRGLLAERGFKYASDEIIPEGRPALDAALPIIPVTMRPVWETQLGVASIGNELAKGMASQAGRTDFSCAYFHPSYLAKRVLSGFEALLDCLAKESVTPLKMNDVAKLMVEAAHNRP